MQQALQYEDAKGAERHGLSAQGAILFSIFDWWYSSHGHSDIQLAKAISRETTVLFVNSIGMRLPKAANSTAPQKRILRKLRSMTRRAVKIDASLLVETPIAFPLYQGLGEGIMRRLVVGQIRRSLARLKIQRPMIFVTVPTFARIALSMPRSSLVYLRSDRHSAYPGVDQALVRSYEQMLFEQADVVAYSNRSLFELEAPSLGERARFIGHGIDASRFSPVGETAADIMALPRPLVGFFGELRERAIDFPLVAEVARRLPDVHFVLGGPSLEAATDLTSLPNVHIVGACPHEAMPARWRSLDLAMLPYRRTAWQDVCEPIKLLEILATGLKGVGTPLAALRGHPDQISAADGAEAFADAIRSRLAEPAERPCPSAGGAMAFRTWDEIAVEMLADRWPPRGAAMSHAKQVAT